MMETEVYRLLPTFMFIQWESDGNASQWSNHECGEKLQVSTQFSESFVSWLNGFSRWAIDAIQIHYNDL